MPIHAKRRYKILDASNPPRPLASGRVEVWPVAPFLQSSNPLIQGEGLPSPYPLPGGSARRAVGALLAGRSQPERRRQPPDASRRLQDDSKTAPGRSKTAPRRSKTPQDAPKTFQDTPETLQIPPRHPQDTPKTPPRRDVGGFGSLKRS